MGSVTKPVTVALAVCALLPALAVARAPGGRILTIALPVEVTITDTASVQLLLAAMLAPVNPNVLPVVATVPAQVFCAFGVPAKAKPAGKTSETATPVAATALLLESTKVSVNGVLIGTELALKALLMVGFAKIDVGSLAPLLVDAAALSPPPLTLAKFTVETAVRLTCTVISISGQLDPAVSTSLRVHVTTAAGMALQDQPGAVMAVAVMLLGRVSVIVTVPKLLPLPWFVTAKV